MQVREFEQKLENSVLEKYGVINVFQNDKIKEKIKETMQEKYHCDNSQQCKEIREKTYATNLKIYGVKHPLTIFPNPEKAKRTCLKRYGNEYAIASESVRQKILQSLYENGTQQCSAQQKYVCELYGGLLNYPVGNCCIDIYFPEEKIYCEWDGGGHNISKFFGKTEKELQTREVRRAYYLKTVGLKEFRIVSIKDYVPSDNILLDMKKRAFGFLLGTEHSWIRFDIEKGMIFYNGGQEEYNFKQS